LPPVIPSATTALISDSMPASRAIAKAGWTGSEIIAASTRGQWKGRQPRRHAPEATAHCLDIEPEQPRGYGARDDGQQRARNVSDDARRHADGDDGEHSDHERRGPNGPEGPGVRDQPRHEVSVLHREIQAERVGYLAHGDHDGYPGGEAHGDRIRDEADDRSHAREGHRDEHDAGHQRRDREPVVPVALHDSEHEHDEGTGRPTDLDTTSGQDGNREAGHDGRIQPLLGSDAGSDGEGDREGKRDHTDDDTGEDLPRDPATVDAFVENVEELGTQLGRQPPSLGAHRALEGGASATSTS
jgi:hypothetical protein